LYKVIIALAMCQLYFTGKGVLGIISSVAAYRKIWGGCATSAQQIYNPWAKIS
jgi:hypothetical protein